MVYNLCAERVYVSTKFNMRGQPVSPLALLLLPASALLFSTAATHTAPSTNTTTTAPFFFCFFNFFYSRRSPTTTVRVFPFMDHNSPPLHQIPEMCYSLVRGLLVGPLLAWFSTLLASDVAPLPSMQYLFLAQDPEHVAAIHCKAGKVHTHARARTLLPSTLFTSAW